MGLIMAHNLFKMNNEGFYSSVIRNYMNESLRCWFHGITMSQFHHACVWPFIWLIHSPKYMFMHYPLERNAALFSHMFAQNETTDKNDTNLNLACISTI